jgi:hypothetical protein
VINCLFDEHLRHSFSFAYSLAIFIVEGKLSKTYIFGGPTQAKTTVMKLVWLEGVAQLDVPKLDLAHRLFQAFPNSNINTKQPKAVTRQSTMKPTASPIPKAIKATIKHPSPITFTQTALG